MDVSIFRERKFHDEFLQKKVRIFCVFFGPNLSDLTTSMYVRHHPVLKKKGNVTQLDRLNVLFDVPNKHKKIYSFEFPNLFSFRKIFKKIGFFTDSRRAFLLSFPLHSGLLSYCLTCGGAVTLGTSPLMLAVL